MKPLASTDRLWHRLDFSLLDKESTDEPAEHAQCVVLDPVQLRLLCQIEHRRDIELHFWGFQYPRMLLPCQAKHFVLDQDKYCREFARCHRQDD